jgi:hypothetical protein
MRVPANLRNELTFETGREIATFAGNPLTNFLSGNKLGSCLLDWWVWQEVQRFYGQNVITGIAMIKGWRISRNWESMQTMSLRRSKEFL